MKNVLPAHGQPQQLPFEQLDEQLAALGTHAELQLGVLHVVLQLEEQEAAPIWLVGAIAPSRSSAINRFFFIIKIPSFM